VPGDDIGAQSPIRFIEPDRALDSWICRVFCAEPLGGFAAICWMAREARRHFGGKRSGNTPSSALPTEPEMNGKPLAPGVFTVYK
jgi:hypothetical protein